jgi:hypothetical protein
MFFDNEENETILDEEMWLFQETFLLRNNCDSSPKQDYTVHEFTLRLHPYKTKIDWKICMGNAIFVW